MNQISLPRQCTEHRLSAQASLSAWSVSRAPHANGERTVLDRAPALITNQAFRTLLACEPLLLGLSYLELAALARGDADTAGAAAGAWACVGGQRKDRARKS